MTKSRIAVMATVAIIAAVAAAASVRAGSDGIAFPNDYAKGVAYKTEDRLDNKQVREFFTSREAVRAAREGAPLPSGTVIAVVRYAAQLDAEGNPAKDANGRFIKTTNILGYSVREKRAGWGAVPRGSATASGSIGSFAPTGPPIRTPITTNCFGCHKSQEGQEYMFTFDSLKVALR
jgi:hypothetical protein